MKTFRKGGIHPPELKTTADCPILEMPVPVELRIMLSQNIGAPSRPVVKPGEHVEAGQMIAEATGFVSVPIHSPVAGTVKKLEQTRTQQGIWQDSIVIATDPESAGVAPSPRSAEEVESLSSPDIINEVRNAGIVGLGGATFPTHVKLTVPQGKKADYVLINGAECEPCLTCDDALMKSHPEEIILGTLLLMKATGAPEGVIGIEENKPEAITAMKAAAAPHSNLSVCVLKKKYPQGGEKQLINAITGRVVPAGGLPIDTGCIVDNVATAFAVWDAVWQRRPLTRRIITVTGEGLDKPGNFIVANGTLINDIFQQCGGLPEGTGKVIAGGPMMGRAVSCLESSATKGLSGLVVMPMKDSFRETVQPCIRCARCVSACPMGLEPYLLILQADTHRWEDMDAHGVRNCIECGSCSYICPSSRPLLDMIKLGKQELRKK